MKNSIMIFFIPLLLNSCSLFQHEGAKIEVNKMTFHELQNHYRKSESLAGKTFHATVTPMIPSLMQKDYKQKAYNLNLSSIKIQNNYNKEMELLNQGLTCFKTQLKIERPNSMEAADFKNWMAEIEDSEGNQYFVDWQSDTLMTIPHKSERNTYHGKSLVWLNKGIGCIKARIKINHGLKLTMYLDKKYVPWPFGSKMEINWPTHQFKLVEGKKVYQEPTKKIKFNYRGW